MDPITLIVTALAAGAALGVSDTASSAVKDAYAGLKALVKKQFRGKADAELVLAKHEQASETWRAPLVAELGEAGADRDTELLAAAQALMGLIDAAGTQAGKYTGRSAGRAGGAGRGSQQAGQRIQRPTGRLKGSESGVPR